MKPLPVIICPLSFFGDEVAGDTADQVALNLLAGTSIALSWRATPRRELPDLRAAFKGQRLSPEAKAACRAVEAIYHKLGQKAETAPAPAP